MLSIKEKRNYLKDDILEKLELKIGDHKKTIVILEQKIMDQQYKIDNLERAKQIVKQLSIDELAISRLEAIEMICDLLNGGMLD